MRVRRRLGLSWKMGWPERRELRVGHLACSIALMAPQFQGTGLDAHTKSRNAIFTRVPIARAAPVQCRSDGEALPTHITVEVSTNITVSINAIVILIITLRWILILTTTVLGRVFEDLQCMLAWATHTCRKIAKQKSGLIRLSCSLAYLLS